MIEGKRVFQREIPDEMRIQLTLQFDPVEKNLLEILQRSHRRLSVFQLIPRLEERDIYLSPQVVAHKLAILCYLQVIEREKRSRGYFYALKREEE
jgi:hypothetical protein